VSFSLARRTRPSPLPCRFARTGRRSREQDAPPIAADGVVLGRRARLSSLAFSPDPRYRKGGTMGKKAISVRRVTKRSIRATLLTAEERDFLRKNAGYEGIAYHKRSPGDFGLTPPAAPRPDKTLCDEANVTRRAIADTLLARAINGGLVSDATGAPGFPKQLWVVAEDGQVFEAMYGGSSTGLYHGYPIRRNDPFFDEVIHAWGRRDV